MLAGAATAAVALTVSTDAPAAQDRDALPERSMNTRYWKGSATWPDGRRREAFASGFADGTVTLGIAVRWRGRDCRSDLRGALWSDLTMPSDRAARALGDGGRLRATWTAGGDAGDVGVWWRYAVRGTLTEAGGHGTIRVRAWQEDARGRRQFTCPTRRLSWRLGAARAVE
jgi:hypothetical protein